MLVQEEYENLLRVSMKIQENNNPNEGQYNETNSHIKNAELIIWFSRLYSTFGECNRWDYGDSFGESFKTRHDMTPPFQTYHYLKIGQHIF